MTALTPCNVYGKCKISGNQRLSAALFVVVCIGCVIVRQIGDAGEKIRLLTNKNGPGTKPGPVYTAMR